MSETLNRVRDLGTGIIALTLQPTNREKVPVGPTIAFHARVRPELASPSPNQDLRLYLGSLPTELSDLARNETHFFKVIANASGRTEEFFGCYRPWRDRSGQNPFLQLYEDTPEADD